MVAKAVFSNPSDLRENIRAARGEIPCDLVIKDASYLDVMSGEFLSGDVALNRGQIVGTGDKYEGHQEISAQGKFVVPGFIDSHVHIESSMMVPSRFQQAVLPFGTTSVIWDPHEIANVKGVAGIEWALESTEQLDLDVYVMVPSCVPSTSAELSFETSGAELYVQDLEKFKDHPRVLGLAEMMNFPGLLAGADDVVSKLQSFQYLKRDGHCPGLLGKDLNAYGVAGIHSCHESTTIGEAREKLQKGLHVLIREGSCAKDAKTLLPLIDAYSSAVLMLCSDDRNPLDIRREGHISYIVKLALSLGIEASHIFRAASFAAARAFGLDDRGVIAPGFLADLIVIEAVGGDFKSGFKIDAVFKRGKRVDQESLSKVESTVAAFSSVRNLNLPEASEEQFAIISQSAGGAVPANVIGVIPNQIVTKRLKFELGVDEQGRVGPDLQQDILKITVLERHHGTGRFATGFVHGFGLQAGAIATSINHDSHNVIAVGTSDKLIAQAVNKLREIDGGIVVVDGREAEHCLRLPLGGLMTDEDPEKVADQIDQLKQVALAIGCNLDEPFLTLSFLALPVIPSLKITDRGLIDVDAFKLISVC